MKIDGYRAGIESTQTDATQKVTADPRLTKSGTRQATSSGDTVEVSADAKLLSAAVKTADGTPGIRTDVVERMKEKLAAGEIGNDAGRLADRMLDDILDK